MPFPVRGVEASAGRDTEARKLAPNNDLATPQSQKAAKMAQRQMPVVGVSHHWSSKEVGGWGGPCWSNKSRHSQATRKYLVRLSRFDEQFFNDSPLLCLCVSRLDLCSAGQSRATTSVSSYRPLNLKAALPCSMLALPVAAIGGQGTGLAVSEKRLSSFVWVTCGRAESVDSGDGLGSAVAQPPPVTPHCLRFSSLRNRLWWDRVLQTCRLFEYLVFILNHTRESLLHYRPPSLPGPITGCLAGPPVQDFDR